MVDFFFNTSAEAGPIATNALAASHALLSRYCSRIGTALAEPVFA